MRRFFFILFCMLLISSTAISKEIKVGIYVLNLGKLDISTGSFTADFYLSMKSDEPIPDSSFEFVNGRATSVDKLMVSGDGKEIFYRIMANLTTPIDLKHFPFDTQKIQIIIEDKTNSIDKVRYVPLEEESGLDPAIVFPGWGIEGWSFTNAEHFYETYKETYSQAIFSLTIKRIPFNSFLKTFLPSMFMMLIVFSSFILNPEQVATRLAAISSTLIATAMFHVSITNQIPPVGYLTFADKYMLLTYFILLACFFLSLYVFVLQGKNETQKAKKLSLITERIVFIGAPVLYAALFLFFK